MCPPRVKDYCIQQGKRWDTRSLAPLCSALEYYEDLLRSYAAWARLFPYHLAGYLCRVMRITPFK